MLTYIADNNYNATTTLRCDHISSAELNSLQLYISPGRQGTQSINPTLSKYVILLSRHVNNQVIFYLVLTVIFRQTVAIYVFSKH